MSLRNKQWLLISRATGEPTPENFKLVETEVLDLQDGEVVVRHHYLSLDPYMRGRMTDAKNYATLQPLNEVMIGGTVGEVVASKNLAFAVGDRWWAWAAGSCTNTLPPPISVACARWTRTAFPCPPISARLACRA